jgi:hypothetical protein
MKTISTNRSLNENFKRAQLLPVLDPEIMARLRTGGAWSVVKAAANPAAAARSHHDRPLPRAAHAAPERPFPTVLGLSVLVCLGQALALLTNWPSNWIALAAWVSRLAG